MTRARLGVLLLLVSSARPVAAAILPTDFKVEPVLVNAFEPGRPVAFATLPDGRIFIVERNTAQIRLFAPGAASAPVIHTVTDVGFVAERGLLGIAVDPQWPVRPFVYIFYTHTDLTARVEMLTAAGDLSDSRSVSLSFPGAYSLLADLPDAVQIHNGGTLRFGPDANLYVSVGDDDDGCNAQTLDSLAGAILRLDVSNMPGPGAGPPAKAAITPAGNPFVGLGERAALVWAWGLRNPFRFTIDPLTNDVFIGDVGSTFFEEVNHVPFEGGGGENFGWPHREGPTDPKLGLACGSGNSFTDDIYHYEHDDVASVVVGPRYRPNGGPFAFPASYDGALFVAEIWQGWVRWIVDTGAGWVPLPAARGQPSASDWGTGVNRCVDAQQHADGAVYFLQLAPFAGTASGLYRIVPIRRVAASTSRERGSRVVPNPAPATGEVRILFGAERTGRHMVRILDGSGRTVRTLFGWTVAREDGVVRWDGRTDRGPAASGVYFYAITDPHGLTHRGKITVVR